MTKTLLGLCWNTCTANYQESKISLSVHELFKYLQFDLKTSVLPVALSKYMDGEKFL